MMPRIKETMKTKIITTAVEAMVCFGVGQVTFFNSIFASLRNWLPFELLLLFFLLFLPFKNP